MRTPALCASVLVTSLSVMSCGQSKAPVSPVHGGDAGVAETNDVAACEPVKEKAMSLYALAAETESVAEDLRAGYLRANVQMVMNDCQVRPKLVAPCVLKAASATEVEANCLLALDDAGDVEGRAFAGPSTGESTPAR